MNLKDFYQRDYYILVRNSEEEEFVDLLNQSTNLVDESNLYILKIIDRLIPLLQQDKDGLPDISGIFNGEQNLDAKVIHELSNHRLLLSIDNNDLTSKLFTNALTKLCKRLFNKDGHNDEGYVIQAYVHSWLECLLAKAICRDHRFSELPVIMKLIDQTEMLHYFYKSLKTYIPNDWILNQRPQWTTPSEEISDVLRHVMTFDKEYFESYKSRLSKLKEATPWNFIIESTRYSDHVMFSRELSFKSSVLFERDLAGWILFWDNLKLPVLQDVPFHYINYPGDFIRLASGLESAKDSLKSKPAHLACILLKNIFECANTVTQRLSFYEDSDRLNALSPHENRSDIISNGREALKHWREEKARVYHDLIQSVSNILEIESIEEWIFSYRPRSSPQNQFTDSFNSELELLIDSYRSYAKPLPFEVEIIQTKKRLNLQKFNFFVSRKSDVKLTEGQIDEILDLLFEFTLTDNFFWDNTFSPPFWKTLKAVGLVLSASSNPGLKSMALLEKVRVHHEGWNVKHDNYKAATRESFFICGVCLLFEHESAFKDSAERRSFFEGLLDLIIEQSRFSATSINDNYRVTLHLLYLIVNQIHTDLKEYYEVQIVNNLDDLNLILAILTAGDYPLDISAKDLLKIRVENELATERKRSRRSKGANHLEESIVKLGLD